MNPTTNVLAGERIRLRELREEDLPDLVAWWQDPEVMVTQTNGPIHPRQAGPIAEQFRSWGRNDGGNAGLVVVTGDGETVLGQVSLFGADVKNRTATYAIIIGPPHQGHGYGLAATRLMLRFGFAELNLHRIRLDVIGYNERAIHTYAKAGFVEEGRDREAVFRGGAWHDNVRMAILAREWWAANPE